MTTALITNPRTARLWTIGLVLAVAVGLLLSCAGVQ
jgi:hypothetical protein